jgi:uncharacterized membrane protein
MKRNCSISPTRLAAVFAVLGLASILIAAGFAAFGAWGILPFAGIEVAALIVAFLIVARHATDYERIELDAQRLEVEVEEAGTVESRVMDRMTARVRVESSPGPRVLLAHRRNGMRADAIEVGKHLDARARLVLASELHRRLSI